MESILKIVDSKEFHEIKKILSIVYSMKRNCIVRNWLNHRSVCGLRLRILIKNILRIFVFIRF